MTTDNTHIRRIMIRKNRNPSVEIQRKISLSSSPMNQSEYMKSSICTDKSDCAPSLFRSCKVRRKRVLKFDPKFEEFLSHNHKSCLKDLNCSINTYEGVSACFDDKMKKKLRDRVHKSCSRERPNRRRPKITISNEILIVQENFELPDIKKASEDLQTSEYKRNISKNSKKKIGSEKPGESRNKTLKQKIRNGDNCRFIHDPNQQAPVKTIPFPSKAAEKQLEGSPPKSLQISKGCFKPPIQSLKPVEEEPEKDII